METIVREINSDEECFDEQAGVQTNSLRRMNTGFNGFAQYEQNRQVPLNHPADRSPPETTEEPLTEEEDVLEAKLTAISQAHLANSQQAFNIIKDTCFEVIRQKEATILQLQHENQRLCHGGGHITGGTGESPPNLRLGSSSPIKTTQHAWSLDDVAGTLREAAQEKRGAHNSKPVSPVMAYNSNGPVAPPSATRVVTPNGQAPQMDRNDSKITFDARVSFASSRTSSRSNDSDEVISRPLPEQKKQQYRSKSMFRLGFSDTFTTSKSFEEEVTGKNRTRSSMKRASVADLAAKIKEDERKEGASQQMQQAQKGKQNAVFIDAAAMKERVKEAIMQPEYNVMNFYKTSGFWQMIARHPWFENITLAIIAFNALWIAVDTDKNKAPTLVVAHPIFVVAENSFCVYFTAEVLIRFAAFKHKSNCVRDAWFVFDSLLVFMMVAETWVMSAVLIATGEGNGAALGNASILRLVRLLRLTRMARMARLLRAMPELMILIKGISVATRSVFFTLCLLGIIIYIFGVAFAQLAQETPLENQYFKSVPDSMSSLLLRGVLPDLNEFVGSVGQENIAYAVLLLFFVLLSSLTVMNMLVGVLVEVVSVVSNVEKEQMTVQFVKTMLLAMLQHSGIDADRNKRISRPEFESLLLKPEAARIIQEVGVDVVGLVDFADFIFKDGVELTFPEFMEIVLQLRGSNTATVRDIVDLRKFVLNQMDQAVEDITACVTTKSEELMFARQTHNPVNNSDASIKTPILAHAASGNLGEKQRGATTRSRSANAKLRAQLSSQALNFGIADKVTSYGSGGVQNHDPRASSTDGSRSSTQGAGYRPQSGVSNPQPLPAFPSMWMTELEYEETPTMEMKRGMAHTRRL